MNSRREVMRLSLLGAPLLFTVCREPKGHLPMDFSDGRIHARPDVDGERVTQPRKGQPQRLGLSANRDGALYVPNRYDPSVAAPALLFLHGAGGAGERAIQRVIEPAEQTGTIVIAPDSRASTWGAVTGEEAPDADFIDAALEKVFDGYAVDPRRILIGGFSDGASAALSTGIVNGDLFSGIVAFSPGFVRLASAPTGQPRVFISHGTHDEILPVDRCGRRIARELRAAGYTVEYREFDGGHEVPDEIRGAAFEWLLKIS